MTYTFTPGCTYRTPDLYTANDGRVFEVTRDDFGEDPRGWIEDSSVAAYIYRGGRGLADDVVPDNPVAAVFAELFDRTGDEDYALRVAQRYARVCYPARGYKVDIHAGYGYSQGDWWETLVVAANGYGTTASHADELGQYLRGDVFTVTDTDTGDSLSGIFADDSEQAIDYYLEGI